MADVDRLFAEYIEQQLAGARPNPWAFIEHLEGAERTELEELIDAYLLDAPPDPWDAEGFRGSVEAGVLENVGRALGGEAGMLPAVLPRLRARAKLVRAELVARLAEALGVGAKKAKVHEYYHQLEQGQLPASGVEDTVFEKLGAILGTSVGELRRAAEALPRLGPEGVAADEVFARTAEADEAWEVTAGESAGASAPPERVEGWDEVDELFRGRGRG